MDPAVPSHVIHLERRAKQKEFRVLSDIRIRDGSIDFLSDIRIRDGSIDLGRTPAQSTLPAEEYRDNSKKQDDINSKSVTN
ncbi:hypothetical protein QE152_g17967 [Popillia japonica]|uniref:Uncharacterized protein n=1 Tax=Popillia japonica TaxID=7064 RepID=A0AAW1L1J6_POPJA